MTREERIRRMKDAGIPMPITNPLNEGGVSSVPITAQNADKHAKLQALKSGANRNAVQSLVKATSVQQQGFQGIPESKPKRKMTDPNQGPVKAVEVVNNFGPVSPVNGELAALEAMMGGVGGASAPAYNPNMNVNQNIHNHQPELTVNQDGYGPVFDPIAMLNKKRQNSVQTQQESTPQNSQYTKYMNPISQVQMANALNQVGTPEQQNFDFQNMQKMMEQIAKNTISQVLDSYTEKNRDKLTYEHVNVKTQDGTQVIKTQDGNYYKLVPVKIKKN